MMLYGLWKNHLGSKPKVSVVEDGDLGERELIREAIDRGHRIVDPLEFMSEQEEQVVLIFRGEPLELRLLSYLYDQE